MNLTVTQNVTKLTLTVGYNDDVITLNPVVNALVGRYAKIDGFDVIAEGKSDLAAFEVGDKFEGWHLNRYVVGVILSLPVILPDDLDDKTKVGLAINRTY